ncbi:transposase [Catalinimonas alkaloidigena]|uniref:hypothetical protein n=1 Tax=Catalinimonas alkaloidigena TaxID=1075417 RepID=UPI0024076A9A|nr:hypothetical protein [Catalinimonas alkaloidigena]MDF9800799.1 transposase [Catalinimonas alkaloidigena]
MFTERFAEFSLDEKVWFINTKCTFIGERTGKLYVYFLYEYNKQYFEVAWEISTGEPVGVDIFENADRLRSYLKDININELMRI